MGVHGGGVFDFCGVCAGRKSSGRAGVLSSLLRTLFDTACLTSFGAYDVMCADR